MNQSRMVLTRNCALNKMAKRKARREVKRTIGSRRIKVPPLLNAEILGVKTESSQWWIGVTSPLHSKWLGRGFERNCLISPVVLCSVGGVCEHVAVPKR